MGGSGHPGDLLNALGIPTVPLYVHRNYDLPTAYLNGMGLQRPLVIASSYSGNTEETLTCYRAARAQQLPLLASASGGTLRDWTQRDGVAFLHIDYPGMQPRHTLLAAFAGITAALAGSGLARDITESLRAAADVLAKTTPGLAEPAKELARKIRGRIPVYTSGDRLGFAAKNFKIQTNENAKYPAFWNVFPELNHNELVGFSKLNESGNQNRFIAVMLHDEEDHPRVKARMAVTAELYRSWGVEVADFTAPGETLLDKVLATVAFGLWTTNFLARELGIDPVPVEGVEGFKKRLIEIAGEA
jgi:glucose/mannose-6-phosphate isomerase